MNVHFYMTPFIDCIFYLSHKLHIVVAHSNNIINFLFYLSQKSDELHSLKRKLNDIELPKGLVTPNPSDTEDESDLPPRKRMYARDSINARWAVV